MALHASEGRNVSGIVQGMMIASPSSSRQRLSDESESSGQSCLQKAYGTRSGSSSITSLMLSPQSVFTGVATFTIFIKEIPVATGQSPADRILVKGFGGSFGSTAAAFIAPIVSVEPFSASFGAASATCIRGGTVPFPTSRQPRPGNSTTVRLPDLP